MPTPTQKEKNARLTGRAGSHYFWEFLMLFLAVFCGFLAEYTLEHKIEKTREKQFIQSLYNDLKTDTANITALNAFRLNILNQADSLFDLLTSGSYAEKGFKIYYHASSLSRRAFFYATDGTMQQLKNSGGLRLISNKQIVDSIQAYDVLYRSILQIQALEEEQVIKYRELASKIFDAGTLRKFFRGNLNKFQDSLMLANLKLKQNDPVLINELSNSLSYRTGNSFRIFSDLEVLKRKATDLIMLLKKKYQLE
jgi:hypothetical protein